MKDKTSVLSVDGNVRYTSALITTENMKISGQMMNFQFDVHVTVHRRHSEGKEPNRCDKVCSFYCLNMFRAPIRPSSGVQLITSAFRWPYLESRLGSVALDCY
jgi:hypothetical protein